MHSNFGPQPFDWGSHNSNSRLYSKIKPCKIASQSNPPSYSFARSPCNDKTIAGHVVPHFQQMQGGQMSTVMPVSFLCHSLSMSAQWM